MALWPTVNIGRVEVASGGNVEKEKLPVVVMLRRRTPTTKTTSEETRDTSFCCLCHLERPNC